MIKRIKAIVYVLAVLLSPASSYAAAANEYYVYNGFGPVSSAFQKIALIFSDNGYLVFFTCFAALSLTFGAAATYAKMMRGGQSGYLSWVFPVVFGTMIYLGAFVPKTHIEIYDAVLNQNISIPGVPVGIVYTATMLNHIERVLVDIINTSAPVGRDYTLTAGGIGIDLLGKSVANTAKDSNVTRTMGEFVQKCVMFELTRPGTALSMQLLLVPAAGNTILDEMVAAKNPGVYTVDYMTVPEGVPETCSVVYDNLNTYYTTASNMSSALSNSCGAAGIDTTDAAALARCQAILTDTASNTFGTAVTATSVMSNATVATITGDYIKSASGAVATEFSAATNITQSGAADGFSSIFNSISRSVFTAFVIALIPLVALFVPTPLCKNAMAMILGLFVWVIVWNICELVVHHFFMDYYYRTVSSITNAGFGMQAMLDVPSYTSVTMGMFGKLKAGAAAFATVVTGGILKFGGSEMSHFAARISQSVSGSQASMLGTTGRAAALGEHQHKQELLAMARMTSPWENQGAVGMDQLANGKASMMMGRAAQGQGMMDFSGGQPGLMWDNTSAIAQNSTAKQFGEAANLGTADAIKSGAVTANEIKGGLRAMGSNYAATANETAFTATMQKTSAASKYDSMVTAYANAANINMNTETGRKQAYGEFAALDLAPKKAVMNAFSDKDNNGNIIVGSGVTNYQQFQELNHGKSRGQIDGEAAAFASAKEAGFKGDWRGYHALQSQMTSTNGYANANEWKNIADEHYGGKSLDMFSDIQHVQNTQGAGQATGALKQEQMAMNQGIEKQLHSAGITDGKTIGEAQEGYRLNGFAGMKDALGRSEWGQQHPDKVGQVAENAHTAAVSQGIFTQSQAGGEMNYLSGAGKADTYWNTEDKNDFRKYAGNTLSKDLGSNVDAVAVMARNFGMGPREMAGFIKSHDEMKSVAGYQEAEKFAGDHNKGFVDLSRASSRVFSMSLSNQEAQQWLGKGAKGGQYSVAVGEDGRSVFRDEKSGHQFQRGAFGKDGSSVIHYNEEGKKIGKWTDINNALTQKEGKDINYLDHLRQDRWSGEAGDFQFKDAKYESDGTNFRITGKDKDSNNLQVVEGKLTKGSDGKIHLDVQRSSSDGGAQFTADSVANDLKTGHVNHSAFSSPQAQSNYAAAFANEVGRTLATQATEAQSTSQGGGVNIGKDSKSATSGGPGESTAGKLGASLSLGANYTQQGVTNINVINTKAQKILEDARRESGGDIGKASSIAGPKLQELRDRAYINSSYRRQDFFGGGSPTTKTDGTSRGQHPVDKVVGVAKQVAGKVPKSGKEIADNTKNYLVEHGNNTREKMEYEVPRRFNFMDPD